MFSDHFAVIFRYDSRFIMRAHVNNFVLLFRPPVYYGRTVQKPLPAHERRLHSDVVSVAAARPAPVAEPQPARPPLTDLLGRRHNYLRISLTERCNLRCQYCMPAEGVPLSARSALLSRSELSRAVRLMATLGVDKVRLTGGEPTLRSDLADIIEDISSVEGIKAISMTTNGLVLTRRLPALQRAGLTAINVSLDSLRPERYEKMARRPGLSRVLAGVDLALQLGYRPVKINVVLMKGFNDDEIGDFVEYTRDREVEIRFIEFMPFSGNAWDGSKLVPHRVAVRALTQRHPDAAPALPRPNDTARVWKVPGFAGSVGFISSMTNHFCSTCNRLRLTADGNLKVCLFGAAEVSLRDALRSGATDQDLEDLVRAALRNKKPQHAESRANGQPADDSHRRVDHHYSDVALAARAGRYTAGLEALRQTTTPLAAPLSAATLGRYAAPAEKLRQSPTASFAAHLTHPEARKSAAPGLNLRLPPTALLAASLSSPKLPALSRGWCSGPNSPGLSHLDASGRARMVDISDKEVTVRTAEAACSLHVSGHVLRLLRTARLAKGDALTVAQLAGVLAAKRTSDLIPLCHQLPLDSVRVRLTLPPGDAAGDVTVHCSVRATARTGAEMEALTGAALAALALYDMCKSADRYMRLTDLRVIRKTGGRSGDWPREPEPEPKVRDLDTTPHEPKETYVPTNVMQF